MTDRPSAPAVLTSGRTQPAAIIAGSGAFPSPTPHYRFSEARAEQEAQLAINPLMRRLAASRAAMADDPYRPAFHFVSPESLLNDPNGLCFWRGRWHLFYQAYPPDEFPDQQDSGRRRQHWGHAISDDLVHWRDLPYAIYPGVDKMIFSGGKLVEDDRVIAFYPGVGIGKPGSANMTDLTAAMMVAKSSDPLLLNWEKSSALDLTGADSDIWKQGDTYYGVLGGADPYHLESTVMPDRFRHPFHQKMYGLGVWPAWSIWTSKDLKAWDPAGDLLLEKTPFADRYDEGACPNFQAIGDKHIMLFFSHVNGAQYLLGDYDAAMGKFRPYDHGRFNHGQVTPGGVHAPSAATDANGDVINILNINAGRPVAGWDQILSLPQRLSLDADKRLMINPIEAVATLRGAHRQIAQVELPANEEMVLNGISGNMLELGVEIDPREAQQIELTLLRSHDAQERTRIIFFNAGREQNPAAHHTKPEIVLDGSESSILNDVTPRPPERAVLAKGSRDPLKLRVFVDRSVVELFANGTQYLAIRVYPGRPDSLGVSLRARGGTALLKRMDAWQMKAIWPLDSGIGARACVQSTNEPGGLW
jgi:beta-fructofuranosidase